jgi:hypothetical protein
MTMKCWNSTFYAQRFESHYKNSTCINNEKLYDNSGGAQEKKGVGGGGGGGGW